MKIICFFLSLSFSLSVTLSVTLSVIKLIEEPVMGKEKKRKKLDEIVLGLSAAKEQKTFPDPSLPSSKKPQIPPSVSVTPTNIQSSMASQQLQQQQQQQQQNQKPFTITVTTVPGSEFESLSISN